MSEITCLIQHALVKAKHDLEWMGLNIDAGHVRSVAAARLRFTSLSRPDEADMLAAMARELEDATMGTCSYCGATHST